MQLRRWAGWGILTAGLVMMMLGFLRGEDMQVLRKAAAVCLECIGIG